MSDIGEPRIESPERAPATAAKPPSAAQGPEQLRYARLLERGTRVGLLVLILTFGAYLSGLVPPHVPLEQLPQLWSHPVETYLAETGTPLGWGWLWLLDRSDIMSMTGMVILAGISMLCLLALVPMYKARGDKAFAAICLAEVAVVLLAASGVLTLAH
jgi:hypothetical protein